MTSSTSNSEAWRRGWRFTWRSLALLIGGLYAALVIVDPFDSLVLSPDWKRAPASTNQRFSYPALARSPAFDSVVIGTSASRHMEPAALNETLGGRFANLSMNAATPYEHWKLAELFLKHHPEARYFLLALDIRPEMWCSETALPRTTPREFPEWMYDENPWNDFLYLFNGKAVETAGRQAAYLLGLQPPRYDPDGFREFTVLDSQYSIERVRKNIYGQETPLPKPQAASRFIPPSAEPVFPDHDYAGKIAAALPPSTELIVFFVPRHWYRQPADGSEEAWRITACKRSLRRVMAGRANTRVLDFHRRSSFTVKDEHYLDDIHPTVAASREIIAALRGRTSPLFP